MITNLKPYSAYKDAGVEWLGKVPAHWELKPLKRWVRLNTSVLPDTTPADYEFRYIDIGTVGTGFLTREPQRLRFGNAPSRARRVLHMGDTIISTVRTYLKAVYYVDGDAEALVCSTGFAVLTPGPSTQPKYVSYLVLSNTFTDRVTAESVGTAYPAIAEGRLGSFYVPIPPLPEQTGIVRFLDWAERRIRRVIRARKKRINLLEEYKQALIHQAVTGQINVRTGQPYPAYKDSGVEWLGEVPAHWEIRRLGSSVRGCVNGVWGSEANGKDDLPCVRVADFDRYRLRVHLDKPTMRAISSSDRVRRLLEPGDLLLEKSGGGDLQPVGRVVLYDHPTVAVTSNFIARMPVENGYDSIYLTYLHAALYSIELNVRSIKQTTGIQNLDSRTYLSELVAFPPLPEQTAIVEYLDAQTAKIDTAISAARREIELLREYRERLIADVVTGKVDVREVAARLPEEPPEEESEWMDTEEIAEAETVEDDAAAEALAEEEVEI